MSLFNLEVAFDPRCYLWTIALVEWIKVSFDGLFVLSSYFNFYKLGEIPRLGFIDFNRGLKFLEDLLAVFGLTAFYFPFLLFFLYD